MTLESAIRSFLIGLISAFAVWLSSWSASQDFGMFGPLVVAVVGVIVAWIQKFLPSATKAHRAATKASDAAIARTS